MRRSSTPKPLTKSYLIFLSAVLFSTVIFSFSPPKGNDPGVEDPGSSAASNYIELFNGQDLTGWYTFLKNRGRDKDPKKVFTVQDGMIRISGQEWGCITTEKEYQNYHLIAEYKWGDETFKPRKDNARDGGILLHSTGKDGAYSDTWMHSIECQIIEGGTGDILVVGDGSPDFSVTSTLRSESPKVFEPASPNQVTIHKGRIDWHGRDPEWKDVKGFRGSQDVEKALGEWNRIEVIAHGGDIKIFLNGELVNRAFNCTPRKGRIQIQSEGAEMFFRRIDLVPLPPDFRFSYNSDGNNMFGPDEDSPEDFYPYVDEVAAAGVTSFFMSVHFGMTMNFPTKVGDMVGENLSPELEAKVSQSILNVRKLVSTGHDPLGIILDRAKAHQMETFVSFRLNEVHGVNQADSYLFDQFWREHPEWRIGKYGDPVPDFLEGSPSLPGGLNFAIPEVREYRLAQFREICERYDIDGLELDFQRFPMYFKIGEETAGIQIMSDWVGEIRAMMKEVGKKRGRPLLLTARILASPERNKAIGLDPVTWVNEGNLDFVIVSHMSHNDFQLPIERYRQLFPNNFPFYTAIQVEPGMEMYRNIAYPLWQKNVNGVYLFNFFVAKSRYDGYRKKVCDPVHTINDRQSVACGVGDVPPPYDSIMEIGYPVRTKDSILLVANKHSNTLSYVDPTTFEVLETISTGPNPHEIILTPNHKYAYLSNYEPPGNTISVIDLVNRKHIKQIQTGEYGRIHGTAMSPDGRYAYFTAGQSGYVIEVSTQTNEITRTIPTHGKISHMVYVSPDGKYLLTANIVSEDISVIDRYSGELFKKIPAGKGVEGMAFTPDYRYLWALNQSGGSITIIDWERLEPIETFECPGMPVRIRFTEDGKRAFVPGWVESGTLTVLDVASRKEIKRIEVGDYAIGVELSPDGKYVFVGCEDSLEPEILADGSEYIKQHKEDSDGIHVIDTETLEVVSVIKTGLGPDPMIMWYPPAK